MNYKIEYFSQGKTQERNEDSFGYNRNTFVIADGTTDKSGRKYDGKTGGEIVSGLIVDTVLGTSLDGGELVDHINKKVAELYEYFGITQDIQDPKFRFSSGFISARIRGDTLHITYLGDLGFRVNGKELYQNVKQVDRDGSEARALYIEKTGDIEGARNYILSFLSDLFRYQNNSVDIKGYGVIDGTSTPHVFVKTFQYQLSKIKTLELFTDGYFAHPDGVDIQSWEDMYEKVEKEDPYKYKKYKSTKSVDDRTIMIITFA